MATHNWQDLLVNQDTMMESLSLVLGCSWEWKTVQRTKKWWLLTRVLTTVPDSEVLKDYIVTSSVEILTNLWLWSWKDDSAVESPPCSCRGLEFSSQLHWLLPDIYNSSYRRWLTVFWPPQAWDMHIVHTHTCKQTTPTHNSKWVFKNLT